MKLGIIVGSVRQGRVSHHLANIIAERARQREGVEVQMLDLMELNLPMFDEPISPKYNPDRQVETPAKDWLEALAQVDALVVVSPEYNRSLPGALKNAFDFIAHEVSHKPFGLVSHGSYNGGFTLDHLRTIVPELGGVTIPRFVGLPFGSFDGEGNYSGSLDDLHSQLDAQLEELAKYSAALVAVR